MAFRKQSCTINKSVTSSLSLDPLHELEKSRGLTSEKMGSISQSSHFKKIQNFEADYADAKFTQYESQRTGLRVTVVDRKGPKVYGYFAVATEIHDDSGSRKCAGVPVTQL